MKGEGEEKIREVLSKLLDFKRVLYKIPELNAAWLNQGYIIEKTKEVTSIHLASLALAASLAPKEVQTVLGDIEMEYRRIYGLQPKLESKGEATSE